MSYRPGPDDTYYEDWAMSDEVDEPVPCNPETGGAFLLGALFMLFVLVIAGQL